MARKLTKTAREMVEAAGVAPDDIQAFIEEEAELTADLIKLRMQDFIDDDLVKAGHNRSLEGYTVSVNRSDYTQVSFYDQDIYIPNFELFVDARPEHQALARPINIFDILDEGREELPRKTTGAYPLWSNNADGGKNVPTANQRVQGRGGRFVTQFRAVNRFSSTTPNRPEPRGGPGNEPHIPKSELVGVRFFSKGPLPAVEGRNLYTRMLASINRELSKRDTLPVKVTVKKNG